MSSSQYLIICSSIIIDYSINCRRSSDVFDVFGDVESFLWKDQNNARIEDKCYTGNAKIMQNFLSISRNLCLKL